MTDGRGLRVEQFQSRWQSEPNRPRYAWYLTFDGEPELHRVVVDYQRALQDLNCLDLAPIDTLHLPVQDVGWADELTDEQVDRVVRAATGALGALTALELTVGAATLTPDSAVLTVQPLEAVRTLRDALRAALAEAGVTPPASARPPAVAVAYANEASTAAFARTALSFVQPTSTAVRIGRVDLVRLEGRYRSQDWTVRSTVELGTG